MTWKKAVAFVVIVGAAMVLLLPLPERFYMPCLTAAVVATILALRIGRLPKE